MDKQERWMLRIPSTREGEQFLNKMRKYLNRDSYKLSKMYTGPRPKGTNQHSTRKENATSVRLYVDSKVSLQRVVGVEELENVLSENAQLKRRLDAALAALITIRVRLEDELDWRQ